MTYCFINLLVVFINLISFINFFISYGPYILPLFLLFSITAIDEPVYGQAKGRKKDRKAHVFFIFND